MSEMVAKAPHTYDAQVRAVGERYEVEERFVPVLQRLGWAELAGVRVNGARRLSKKRRKHR